MMMAFCFHLKDKKQCNKWHYHAKNRMAKKRMKKKWNNKLRGKICNEDSNKTTAAAPHKEVHSPTVIVDSQL